MCLWFTTATVDCIQRNSDCGVIVYSWLWEILEQTVGDECGITPGKVLNFTTGSSRVPPGGFAALKPVKFKVETLLDKTTDALPCAHTCTNALQLPIYSSKEQLRNRLAYALAEGGVGFGLA